MLFILKSFNADEACETINGIGVKRVFDPLQSINQLGEPMA